MPETEKGFPKGEKRPTPQDKDREAQKKKLGLAITDLANKKK